MSGFVVQGHILNLKFKNISLATNWNIFFSCSLLRTEIIKAKANSKYE